MKLAAVLFLICLLALVNCSKKSEKGDATKKVIEKELEHKGQKLQGKKSVSYEEKGKKGHSTHDLHEVDDEEKGGKKKKYHSSDHYEKGHEKEGRTGHSANFKQKAGHVKGKYKKGFLEKYHKNEKKAHDRFFSEAHKAGDFQIFGGKKQSFNSQTYDKVEEAEDKDVKAADGGGKKGKKASGHEKKQDKKYKQETEGKTHHKNKEEYVKKDNRAEKKVELYKKTK